MLKKILCILLAFSFVLLSLSGCGRQVETAKVGKETAKTDFASYRQQITGILDKAGIKYKTEIIDLSKNPELKNPENPLLIFKLSLETEDKEVINAAFAYKDQIEEFTVSLDIQRKTLDACKLNIRDYPYVRDIFNLISAIKVSNFGCNHLMNKARKGMEDKYKSRPDAFFISENKYFGRDKTKTWCLQYRISPEESGKTTVFNESLIFKGNLAPRTDTGSTKS